MADRDYYEKISRKKLQSLAKQACFRANQKSAVLIDLLLKQKNAPIGDTNESDECAMVLDKPIEQLLLQASTSTVFVEDKVNAEKNMEEKSSPKIQTHEIIISENNAKDSAQATNTSKDEIYSEVICDSEQVKDLHPEMPRNSKVIETTESLCKVESVTVKTNAVCDENISHHSNIADVKSEEQKNDTENSSEQCAKIGKIPRLKSSRKRLLPEMSVDSTPKATSKKFDLKLSLSKPLSWKMKKGPLPNIRGESSMSASSVFLSPLQKKRNTKALQTTVNKE